MNEILYADVSVLENDNIFERYLSELSPERCVKVQSVHYRKDKNLLLGAGVLLGIGLKKYGISEKEAAYLYGENGKPRIAGHPEIQFSISHSGHYAAVAFSDGIIGCDIEKTENQKIDIRERFFHPDEWDFAESSIGFFRVWTLKESYIKALGTGLSTPLNSFSVVENGEIKNKTVTYDGTVLYFGESADIDGYALSWCCEKSAEVMIEKIEL